VVGKRKKKTRTRLDAHVRRQQILGQAADLIGRRGYYGFSIQDLADRCRLTGAGLLYYFGSKERLLIELIEDRDRRTAAAVRAEIGLLGEPNKQFTMDSIRQAFHATVVHNTTQPESVRLFSKLHAEAMDPSHPAHDYFAARRARVIESYSRLLAPFFSQPATTAIQLIAMMRGLEDLWLGSGQTLDLVAEWDRAAALLLSPSAQKNGARRAKR